MNFPIKPSRTKAALEWLEYHKDSKGLGGILAKTEDLAKLKLTLRDALGVLDLGHLANKIEVGWRANSQNELFLLVSSASIASRLQQILPSLIKELGVRGIQCAAIKVRLKPSANLWEVKGGSEINKQSSPKGFNAAALASWRSLLAQLDPHSELSKDVQKLLQNKKSD
jgi:hypothetical protein